MMSDRSEIVTTLTKLFWSTDHHDWEELRHTLTDRVLMDYTATLGGDPGSVHLMMWSTGGAPLSKPLTLTNILSPTTWWRSWMRRQRRPHPSSPLTSSGVRPGHSEVTIIFGSTGAKEGGR